MARTRPDKPEASGRMTVQFTIEDRALLDRLVQARAEEVRKAVGQDVDVSIVSYLRWLLQKDARERGLLEKDGAVRSAKAGR
jgi:hypothetical protein